MITVSMTVKDEEYTVYNCIRSLRRVADKFIIVDNGSTDNTVDEIARVKRDFFIDLELHRKPEMNFIQCRNFINDRIKEGWVIIADGDFIYHTSGKDNILQIKEIFEKTTRPTIYAMPFICLDGDLEHYKPCIKTGTPLMSPHKYFYRRDWVNGFRLRGRFPYLDTSASVRFLRFNAIYHLKGVKPDEKLWIRRFWTDWRQKHHPEYNVSLDQYIDSKTKPGDREKYLENYFKSLKPFNPADWKSYYPDIVEEMRKAPKYRVVQKDGKRVTL